MSDWNALWLYPLLYIKSLLSNKSYHGHPQGKMEEVPLEKDIRRGCFYVNGCALAVRSLEYVIEYLHDTGNIRVSAKYIVCLYLRPKEHLAHP